MFVHLLFASALSLRSPAYVSVTESHNPKCAIFCHFPPPFKKWHGFLQRRCDPAISLFIDSATFPLKWRSYPSLSYLDLAPAVTDFLNSTYKDTREAVDEIADGYQLLDADLDIAQGILFGQVLDMHESTTRKTIVLKDWTGGNSDKMRCLACVALDEIAALYRETRRLNLDEYKRRRSRCLDDDNEPVTDEQIKQAKVRAEEVLPRTKLLAAYGGIDAIMEKLSAVLPPASETCGGPEECLESQFVNTTTWDPPENLMHLYDKVIFVDCEPHAFEGKAVESAMKLVAPGGEIIIHGHTPEDLEQHFGTTPFAKLSDSWQRSSDENLTVFSELSKKRKLGNEVQH